MVQLFNHKRCIQYIIVISVLGRALSNPVPAGAQAAPSVGSFGGPPPQNFGPPPPNFGLPPPNFGPPPNYFPPPPPNFVPPPPNSNQPPDFGLPPPAVPPPNFNQPPNYMPPPNPFPQQNYQPHPYLYPHPYSHLPFPPPNPPPVALPTPPPPPPTTPAPSPPQPPESVYVDPSYHSPGGFVEREFEPVEVQSHYPQYQSHHYQHHAPPAANQPAPILTNRQAHVLYRQPIIKYIPVQVIGHHHVPLVRTSGTLYPAQNRRLLDAYYDKRRDQSNSAAGRNLAGAYLMNEYMF